MFWEGYRPRAWHLICKRTLALNVDLTISITQILKGCLFVKKRTAESINYGTKYKLRQKLVQNIP